MKQTIFLFAAAVLGCAALTGCKSSQAVPNDYQAYVAYQQQMQKGKTRRNGKPPGRIARSASWTSVSALLRIRPR